MFLDNKLVWIPAFAGMTWVDLKFDYLVNISKNSFLSANPLSGGFSEKPLLLTGFISEKGNLEQY